MLTLPPLIVSVLLRFGPASAAIESGATWYTQANADRVIGFSSTESAITCAEIQATLRGTTYAGESLEAADTLTTTGCDTGCH